MSTMAKLGGVCLAAVLGAAFGADEAAGQSAESRGNWSQWRGPKRDGKADGAAWAKGGPKVKVKPVWKRKIGFGYATVAVGDKRVYTMGYSAGKDTVFCLDAKKGRVLWAYSYPCKKFDNMNAGGPTGTPSVVDGRVYTVSREAQLYCLDAKKGSVIWQKDLRSEVGARVPTWGFSGSPLVYDGKVIVDVGVIVAYDPKTGEQVWKTGNYESGYSSPIHFRHGGKDYLATFPGFGLVILDPASGKEVAKTRWKTNYNVNAATPLVSDDGSEIMISSGYNTGAAMFKFDGSSLSQVWRNRNMRNHMSTCVRLGAYIYGFDDAVLKCISAADGKVLWAERGLGKGTVAMADEVLVVLSAKGTLMFAKASPKGFRPTTQKQVLNGRGCWAAPVLTNDRAYCRSPGGGELVAVSLK